MNLNLDMGPIDDDAMVDNGPAARWFTSLTRTYEDRLLDDSQTIDEQVSLQHSIQLYSVFAETGDDRYLDLCDEFLRQSLPEDFDQ